MSDTITLEDDEIAIIWSAADVLDVRPDLTHDQALDVLHRVEHKHDATIGINWDVLSCHASMLYPEETEE